MKHRLLQNPLEMFLIYKSNQSVENWEMGACQWKRRMNENN